MTALDISRKREVIKLDRSTRRLYFSLSLLTLPFSVAAIWLLFRGAGSGWLFIFLALSVLAIWLACRPAHIVMDPKALTLTLGISKKSNDWAKIGELSHRSSIGGYQLLGNLRYCSRDEQVQLGKFDASLSPMRLISKIHAYQLPLLWDKTPLDYLANNPAQKKLNDSVAQLSFREPLEPVKIGRLDLLIRFKSVIRQNYDACDKTLLALIGSLAGYACRVAGISELDENQKEGVAIVKALDGKTYYYSAKVNNSLYEKQIGSFLGDIHLLSIISGAPLPNVTGILKRNAEMIGSPDFGMTLFLGSQAIKETSLNLLREYWPVFQPIMDQYCRTPEDRVTLLALCARDIIKNVEPDINKNAAVEILMECAVPMSKIGPEWLA